MNEPLDGPGLDRRRFLQLSAGSAAALGLAATSAQLAGCARKAPPPAPGHQYLTAEDLVLFGALLPVVNGSAWVDSAETRTEALRRIDVCCIALDPAAQAQTRQLLDLLQFGLFRRLACGLSRPWGEATHEELAAFLQRWRESGVELFNAGYRGLSKLAAIGWWSQRASWSASRYPGPPAFAVQTLNA